MDFYLTQENEKVNKMSKSIKIHLKPIFRKIHAEASHLQISGIKNYRLIKQIGKGGFSRVILAR